MNSNCRKSNSHLQIDFWCCHYSTPLQIQLLEASSLRVNFQISYDFHSPSPQCLSWLTGPALPIFRFGFPLFDGAFFPPLNAILWGKNCQESFFYQKIIVITTIIFKATICKLTCTTTCFWLVCLPNIIITPFPRWYCIGVSSGGLSHHICFCLGTWGDRVIPWRRRK